MRAEKSADPEHHDEEVDGHVIPISQSIPPEMTGYVAHLNVRHRRHVIPAPPLRLVLEPAYHHVEDFANGLGEREQRCETQQRESNEGRVIMAWEEAVQAAHTFDNRHNDGELDENHLVARQDFSQPNGSCLRQRSSLCRKTTTSSSRGCGSTLKIQRTF